LTTDLSSLFWQFGPRTKNCRKLSESQHGDEIHARATILFQRYSGVRDTLMRFMEASTSSAPSNAMST